MNPSVTMQKNFVTDPRTNENIAGWLNQSVEGAMRKIENNTETLGNAGHFLHVFGLMVAAYTRGLKFVGREIVDVDAAALMQIQALAKMAVETKPVYAHSENAASWALLRTAYMQPMNPENQVKVEREKQGWELAKDIAGVHGLDLSSYEVSALEGLEYPDHWTVREARIFTQYLRECREKERSYRREQEAKVQAEVNALTAAKGVNPLPPRPSFMDAIQGQPERDWNSGMQQQRQAPIRPVDVADFPTVDGLAKG